MTGGYLSGPTWLHRVPAGAKLIALAGLSMALLPVQDWRILAGSAVAVVALYASLGRDAFARLALLRPLLPLLLVIAGLQGISEGWREAAAVVLRLVVMVLMADLITMTVTMAALMAAVAPVLSPLRYVGLSPKVASLAVALVVRFVPVLLSAWRAREEAWRARTARRMSLRVVAGFIAETLRLADHVAEALDARGFDGPPRSGVARPDPGRCP